MVQVHQFGTGTRYGLKTLHKCGKKVETIIQKMFRSNPYVGSSYSGKTGRGPFSRSGRDFFKTFNKVRYTLSGKVSSGKSFCWGKFLSPSQYFVTFHQRKGVLRYNEYI